MLRVGLRFFATAVTIAASFSVFADDVAQQNQFERQVSSAEVLRACTGRSRLSSCPGVVKSLMDYEVSTTGIELCIAPEQFESEALVRTIVAELTPDAVEDVGSGKVAVIKAIKKNYPCGPVRLNGTN